jgi:hypothetical protein
MVGLKPSQLAKGMLGCGERYTLGSETCVVSYRQPPSSKPELRLAAHCFGARNISCPLPAPASSNVNARILPNQATKTQTRYQWLASYIAFILPLPSSHRLEHVFPVRFPLQQQAQDVPPFL